MRLSRTTSSGCTEYENAVLEIYFPKGNACCQFCPLLQTYSRNQCMRTGELIVDTRGRGMWCPLTFLKDEKEE